MKRTFGSFITEFLANPKEESPLVKNLLAEIKTAILKQAGENRNNFETWDSFNSCPNDLLVDLDSGEFTDLGNEVKYRCYEEDLRFEWVPDTDGFFIVQVEN